jgi:hypothetical protein
MIRFVVPQRQADFGLQDVRRFANPYEVFGQAVMRDNKQGDGKYLHTYHGCFWLTFFGPFALFPLALGLGEYAAALCVLACIAMFACLQWTGSGSYVRAAIRCFGFSLGVLSLFAVGIAGKHFLYNRKPLAVREELVQYGRLLPSLVLISILAALLGLLGVFLAQACRQLHRQLRWDPLPLASDPLFRRQFRQAGDASLMFSCFLVYFDGWIHHRTTMLINRKRKYLY